MNGGGEPMKEDLYFIISPKESIFDSFDIFSLSLLLYFFFSFFFK